MSALRHNESEPPAGRNYQRRDGSQPVVPNANEQVVEAKIQTRTLQSPRSLVPELSACVCSCASPHIQKLTRGEMASVFGVCSRSISRWEENFGLPVEQINARVIRYPIETVILLSAHGIPLHRENAVRLGLLPDVILAVAVKQRLLTGKTPPTDMRMSVVSHAVLVAETEDDRHMLSLWADPVKGAALRALVRVM